MIIPRDEVAAANAAEGGTGKSAYVRSIFSEIAPRYDLLNRILSFNIDRRWRKKAIEALAVDVDRRGRYLDLCAGTLDLSVALAAKRGFSGSVVSVDFAEPMLRAGRQKIGAAPISPVVGDALVLPLADASVTAAIVAFGIRNLSDLDAGLRELHRVLVPGGRLVILEFSTPKSNAINRLYQIYSRQILPRVGGLISGHRTAYSYLPRSVAHFPANDELSARLVSAGFISVTSAALTLGVATIHTGGKPGGSRF